MNPPDSFFPPDLLILDQEAEFHRRSLQRARESARRRRRQNNIMAAQQAQADNSSDSEMEGVTSGVKNKMDLTPAGSTPQELVKLDPSEIGMSAGYKHL